ncbi:hypothetical protein BaRGS_00024442 [Batillaria attramentaria]|uniref:Uncharacterized protein n=1 Tax=Batillaria attramentaria TaxID=370345 RepID=A0ABD0KB60_9CAEN
MFAASARTANSMWRAHTLPRRTVFAFHVPQTQPAAEHLVEYEKCLARSATIPRAGPHLTASVRHFTKSLHNQMFKRGSNRDSSGGDSSTIQHECPELPKEDEPQPKRKRQRKETKLDKAYAIVCTYVRYAKLAVFMTLKVLKVTWVPITGAVAAVMSAPYALSTIGFGPDGIIEGSLAATMLSAGAGGIPLYGKLCLAAAGSFLAFMMLQMPVIVIKAKFKSECFFDYSRL